MAHTRPGLREQGLSDQQWRVLRVLGEHGVVETGRVAREAFILGPSLTGVLSRMERDGLIRRERDAADQRRTVVTTTDKGAAMVQELSHTIEAHYAWMEQTLGREQLAELYCLLDTVIELEAQAPQLGRTRRHRPQPAASSPRTGRRAERAGAT